jgi:hypothetical protein
MNKKILNLILVAQFLGSMVWFIYGNKQLAALSFWASLEAMVVFGLLTDEGRHS